MSPDLAAIVAEHAKDVELHQANGRALDLIGKSIVLTVAAEEAMAMGDAQRAVDLLDLSDAAGALAMLEVPD